MESIARGYRQEADRPSRCLSPARRIMAVGMPTVSPRVVDGDQARPPAQQRCGKPVAFAKF